MSTLSTDGTLVYEVPVVYTRTVTYEKDVVFHGDVVVKGSIISYIREDRPIYNGMVVRSRLDLIKAFFSFPKKVI